MGHVAEQALVVNVDGLGLMVLVGWGHRPMPKLMQGLRATFPHRLLGVAGDLHYPVLHGGLSAFNIDRQRRLASERGLAPPDRNGGRGKRPSFAESSEP